MNNYSVVIPSKNLMYLEVAGDPNTHAVTNVVWKFTAIMEAVK